MANSINDKEMYWEHMKILMEEYKCNHFLFNKWQVEYRKQRLKDERVKFTDMSLTLEDDEGPYFGFVGFREIGEIVRSGELPCATREKTNLSRGQKKEIRKFIDKIIATSNELKIIDFLDRGKISYACEYIMSEKKDFKSNTKYNRIIELNAEEEILKNQIRKRYKSFIAWGQKNLRIEITDRANVDAERFDRFMEFRELHDTCAGRRTRSKDTWLIQYEAIKEGYGYFITGYRDGEMVTGGVFNLTSNYAYYGSSASRREMFDKPMFHAVMWEAIKYAKGKGAKYFDTGECNLLTDSDIKTKTDKQIAISNFKAGFGGKLMPRIELYAEKNEG